MTRGEGGGGHTAERGGERRRRRSRYKKDSMSVGNGPIRTGAHRYRVSFPIKVRTGPRIVVHNPTHWPTHWSPRYRVSFPINSLSISLSPIHPPCNLNLLHSSALGGVRLIGFLKLRLVAFHKVLEMRQGSRISILEPPVTRFAHLDIQVSSRASDW